MPRLSWRRASWRWRRARTARSAFTTWTRPWSSTTMMRRPTSPGASERSWKNRWELDNFMLRCLHHLGKNGEAIGDAIMAVERQPYSGEFGVKCTIKCQFPTFHNIISMKFPQKKPWERRYTRQDILKKPSYSFIRATDCVRAVVLTNGLEGDKQKHIVKNFY